MLSDSDLIYEFAFVSPHVMIRVARLSLFARIGKKYPKLHHGFTWSCFDFGWLIALRGDLAWFACSGYLPASLDDLPAVFSHVASSPSAFLSVVRSFSVSYFANFDVPSVYPDLAPPFSNFQYCPDCLKPFLRIRKCP